MKKTKPNSQFDVVPFRTLSALQKIMNILQAECVVTHNGDGIMVLIEVDGDREIGTDKEVDE